MRFDKALSLSPTDLSRHLGCVHLTSLNLAAATGRLKKTKYPDPTLEILQRRGNEHEQAYIDYLRGEGHDVVTVSQGPGDKKTVDDTLAAMKSGADIIYQAPLEYENYRGYADFLRRVDKPSELGDYSYEVIDTKLSKQTKGGTILQLCVYSEIVAHLQGQWPEEMHVVIPGRDYQPETYRTDDFLAFYRRAKQSLEAAVANPHADIATEPEPCAQCDICDWQPHCKKQWRDEDHLSLVAGISKLQRRELADHGIDTLAQLAEMPLPLQFKPSRGSKEAFERAAEQARVQNAARESGRRIIELQVVEPGQGLARLPEPSEGDVFFDYEGDPFIGDGGREYLTGYVTIEDGKPEYTGLWADTAEAERRAFERFIDDMMARWERYPDMHIYHYAPYEPAAVKRLMGRYATREEAVDRLLRAERFVDLYAVVRQGLRASVERYSIKDLEPFYDFEREVDLRTANQQRHALQHLLELGDAGSITKDMRDAVESYNKDDCVSTWRLHLLVEQLREAAVDRWGPMPRPVHDPDGDPSAELDEKAKRCRELMQRLLAGDAGGGEAVPQVRAERNDEQQARWLLAHMLEWHRRAEKSEWWELFNLMEMTDEEMLDEDDGIAGLEFVEQVDTVKRSVIHRYRYPPQQVAFRPKKDLRTSAVEKGRWGQLVAMDRDARTIDVKKSKHAEMHATTVFVHEVFEAKEQKESLYRLGEWVASSSDGGVDADGPYRAARDLLLGRPPRLVDGASLGPVGSSGAADGGSLAPTSSSPNGGEDLLACARRLALQLDHGVLPIQGPPGSGKTYTGARMIIDLVRAGKNVGITANSHKVMRNLTLAALRAGAEEGVSFKCVHQVSPDRFDDTPGEIEETRDNAAVLRKLETGEVSVAVGTAWLWSREEMAESVDVLFVDEAGQLKLTNAVAVAPCASSVVLLGDPQQLDQPLKGAQPEGTEVSALEHILGGEAVMPPDRGLFLAETYRLAPEICGFTSEAFYQSELASVDAASAHRLHGDGAFAGAGLFFEAVSHHGNRNHSPEEVERVCSIVSELVGGGYSWCADSEGGSPRPLALDDIVIVAPYNVHVTALQEALPDGARVGTVDKFQGQEAPVAIYSLATSSPEDAPRGMEFLYSLNRLNVATSRAKAVCILVASPTLLEAECRTPRQMQLANAFCRYVENAK